MGCDLRLSETTDGITAMYPMYDGWAAWSGAFDQTCKNSFLVDGKTKLFSSCQNNFSNPNTTWSQSILDLASCDLSTEDTDPHSSQHLVGCDGGNLTTNATGIYLTVECGSYIPRTRSLCMYRFFISLGTVVTQGF
jgi:hypothetical protein